MKKIFLLTGFVLLGLTALTYFVKPELFGLKKTETTYAERIEVKVDTTVVDTLNSVDTISIAINDTLSDIANFIAGKKSFSTSLLDPLTKDSSWIKYAAKTEALWKKLDTNRYESIRNWSSTQLKEVHDTKYNLFYPFSGPDFLNADLFFPGCDTLTMFGLEPYGSLPAVEKKEFKDSLYKYVASLKTSLNDILQLSFFKTKDMFTDLRGSELNGACHLILWFAARQSYGISHVKHIAIGHDGEIVYDKADTTFKKSGIKGIEIACVKNNKQKIIRYFSADISNHGFKKNPRMGTFLNNYNFTATMVKSASYLMHAGNFTTIRKTILDKTTYVLQDDTGIPYKNIDNKKWDIVFYGTYEKPINLFAKNYQDDLRKAYDSLETKPLPFGIGYKYQKNESTWMFLKSKKESTKEVL